MGAPVNHTCPDIDKAIKRLNDGLRELSHCLKNDDIESIKEGISYSIGLIEDVEPMLEDLRSDNSSLRDWGHDLENQVSDLNDEIYELNQREN